MSGGVKIYKRVAMGAVLLVLSLATIEVLSFAGIWLTGHFLDDEVRRTSDIFQEQTRRIRELIEPNRYKRTIFDPVFGWRYRANYRSGSDRINSQGLRGDREYSQPSGPGIIRVAAFGNSFVYCNEVANQNAWPTLIEKMYPHIEVLNYGVGGYGTDQAYLRFLAEGLDLSPDMVIIGFAPVNLRRVVNVYRRFISNREYPLVKPRFVIGENGDLVLLPNPLQHVSDYERYLHRPRQIIELGTNDYWYEPAVYENWLYDTSAMARLFTAVWVRFHKRYLDPDRILRHGIFNQSSTAFRIQVALLEKFVEAVRASGAITLITIFPDRGSIKGTAKGRQKVFDPLVDYLQAGGLEYVDLSDAFLSEGAGEHADEWFMSGGHYSAAGNGVVAAWLGRQIQTTIAGTKRSRTAFEEN